MLIKLEPKINTNLKKKKQTGWSEYKSIVAYILISKIILNKENVSKLVIKERIN